MSEQHERWPAGSLARAVSVAGLLTSTAALADAVECLTETARSLLSLVRDLRSGDSLDMKVVQAELANYEDVVQRAEEWMKP